MPLLQNFPAELELFKQKILDSETDFIAIETQDSKGLQLWQSKIGGVPYLPLGTTYPTDTAGEPLYLIAQINFEEMPALENFPSKGLLQFYIANDDLYGIDFEDRTTQNTFRIMYIAQIDKENFQRDMPALDAEAFSPLSNPLQAIALRFTKNSEYIGIGDARSKEVLGEEFENIVYENEDIYGWLNENIENHGSKLGGYAHFTQEDPRHGRSINNYNTLLLQLDSDNYLCWGDYGVANFFISSEKLKNLDFSDVFYNWDCT